MSSSQDFAIQVQNISKGFSLLARSGPLHRFYTLLRRSIGYEISLDSVGVHWALKNASLDIRKGEAVGLLGSNGSGKSTLLKLISGVTAPDVGTIHIWGTIVSMLELGVGFHPDLTGRDNLFLFGAILGASSPVVKELIPRAAEFAAIGEYLDEPVRNYSSGMVLRLAFAFAVHLDADIFLFDEILGIGDHEFQTRCLEKVRELKKAGKTLVIVSHHPRTQLEVCDRYVEVRDTGIHESGPPSE